MVPFSERLVPVSEFKLDHPNWIQRGLTVILCFETVETCGLELDAMMLAKSKIPPDDFVLVVSSSHPDFSTQVQRFLDHLDLIGKQWDQDPELGLVLMRTWAVPNEHERHRPCLTSQVKLVLIA